MPPQGVLASILNQNGAFSLVPIFQAAQSGLYLVCCMLHLVSTNGAGTLTITIFSPHLVPAIFNLSGAIASGLDTAGNFKTIWLNAGEVLTCTSNPAGLTGTVFSVFLPVIKVL